MRMTLGVALACALVHAQTKPQFEVASVKPITPKKGLPETDGCA
jgi:hypothetical protein